MDIGYFHPQIVHFVIALLFVGVTARVLSLLPLPKWAEFIGPAATVLIVLGTLAAVAAVKSGDDAHGPPERVPGARDAVLEHEEWGERARNMFLIVAALELAAVGLFSRARVAKGLRATSAVVGLGGLFMVYEAGEHGGQLVYDYAAGVGIRSGDSTDLRQALVATLYHNMLAARQEGRRDDAARYTDELARLRPGDNAARFLVIESRIKDRGDAAGALLALDSIRPAQDDRRGRTQVAFLKADAFESLAQKDSARAVLEALRRDLGDSPRIAQRIEQLR